MIVALAGGTGAAKLLRGLARATDPSRLFVVGNTGDDLEWWGLHVSPDLDSVAYALAGLLDGSRGWGVRDDTFHCLGAMERLGRETWFRLGDRDLATHLHRTLLLRAGASLTAATRAIRSPGSSSLTQQSCTPRRRRAPTRSATMCTRSSPA